LLGRAATRGRAGTRGDPRQLQPRGACPANCPAGDFCSVSGAQTNRTATTSADPAIGVGACSPPPAQPARDSTCLRAALGHALQPRCAGDAPLRPAMRSRAALLAAGLALVLLVLAEAARPLPCSEAGGDSNAAAAAKPRPRRAFGLGLHLFYGLSARSAFMDAIRGSLVAEQARSPRGLTASFPPPFGPHKKAFRTSGRCCKMQAPTTVPAPPQARSGHPAWAAAAAGAGALVAAAARTPPFQPIPLQAALTPPADQRTPPAAQSTPPAEQPTPPEAPQGQRRQPATAALMARVAVAAALRGPLPRPRPRRRALLPRAPHRPRQAPRLGLPPRPRPPPPPPSLPASLAAAALRAGAPPPATRRPVAPRLPRPPQRSLHPGTRPVAPPGAAAVRRRRPPPTHSPHPA
jgi:hypothetical protein